VSLPVPVQIALGLAIVVLASLVAYLEYCEWRQRDPRRKKDIDSW